MVSFTSLAAFALLATGAYAQTQKQIEACANSIKTVSYETYPTYSTSDTTPYSITYSYNVTACTATGVPVNKIYLADTDAGYQYPCTLLVLTALSGRFRTLTSAFSAYHSTTQVC